MQLSPNEGKQLTIAYLRTWLRSLPPSTL